MFSLLAIALLSPSNCPTAHVDGEMMFRAAALAQGAGTHGEHLSKAGYTVATEAYLASARTGNVHAQFRYASLVLSTNYMANGVKPEQKAEYVRALTWLAVAARRGYSKAKSYLPERVMTALLGKPVKGAKADAEGAFSDLPDAWIKEARIASQIMTNCWPDVRPPGRLVHPY